jgi:putative DNA primase/helicase
MTEDERRELEEERAERKRKTAYALKVWDQGVPIAGTPAEYYLALRGLELPTGVEARFHPSCPRRDGAAPALIALLRTIEGDTPTALQRIFIGQDFQKDGQPMMLGPVRGAAMKLISHRACCTGAQTWFMPRLHVCEGFETGLALLQLGYTPAWALGSAGAIERLPLLWFVGQLVIAIDNDVSRAGDAAAAAARLTWGWRASCISTSRVGTDFADLVLEQSQEGRL